MQTIDARALAGLLCDAGVPDDVITPAPAGVTVATTSARDYTLAVTAVAEAIGQGATEEATHAQVTVTGGQYGAAPTLTAVFPGWALSGPLPVLVP